MEVKTKGGDDAARRANLARLKRIEGQVRGLRRMLESDRHCVEVMTQIGSVQQALRAVGREILRGHLKHCAAHALRKGGQESDRACDQLVELFHKNAR